MTPISRFAVFAVSLLAAVGVNAVPVPLQNATATFTQTGPFSPANVIDGNPFTSWAIAHSGGVTGPETLVVETVSNITNAQSLLTFQLGFRDTNFIGAHTLGRFRLSFTTDARTNFADGLGSGGDVTANWQVLTPVQFSSTEGDTANFLPDGSLLVSGVTNQYPIYTVRALATTTAITGFRLEALADASLPAQGPGRQPANGNFVMSEFSVDAIAVPEPSTGLALLGMAAAVTLRRRRNR